MIDKKIQENLRMRFNPDNSVLRKHQLRMLDMLIYFDNFCRKHNLKYWLSSGTLIGAVRHQGFIPWDDDVDVEMLREDYLKMLELLKETDRFILQTKDNDEYYAVPYGKLRDKYSYIDEYGQDKYYKFHGIYIDIFIIEKNNRFIAHCYESIIWKLIDWGSQHKPTYFRKKIFIQFKNIIYGSISIARFLFGWLPSNQWRQTYGGGFYNNIRCYEDIFPLKTTTFENYSFPVPANCDGYLRKIYGNYMELPDLEHLHIHAQNVTFYD